jgi:hypothetical protein
MKRVNRKLEYIFERRDRSTETGIVEVGERWQSNKKRD